MPAQRGRSYKLKPREAALFAAVRAGNRFQVDVLIDGADLTCVDDSGATVVLDAALNGHRELARYLIEKGAPVVGNPKSKTLPLHEFARRGWIELVEIALDAGENPVAPMGNSSPNFSSALALAVPGDHYETVNMLASRFTGPREAITPLLGVLLHKATSAEMVDVLIDNGAEIDYCLIENKQPLFSTVEVGSEGACRALIRHGAELEARWCGFTALYYSIMHDQPAVMIPLIEAQAKMDSCGLNGQGIMDLLPKKPEAARAFAAWEARNKIRDVIRNRASPSKNTTV